MVTCKNCGAKHYDNESVCGNCNHELQPTKTRKANKIYCLEDNMKVTTKRITEQFLEANKDYNGVVYLLENYETPVRYSKNYQGEWIKR